MVEDFLTGYVKLLVNKPEVISVSSKLLTNDLKEVDIYADVNDIGRLIGKKGALIVAIKTFISGIKAKDGYGYKINIRNVNHR